MKTNWRAAHINQQTWDLMDTEVHPVDAYGIQNVQKMHGIKMSESTVPRSKMRVHCLQVQLIAALVSFVFLFLTSITMAQTLETVPNVDLKKYAGKWYEIASFPQRFQQGCHCTTATYTPTEKGYVIVENRCNRDSLNGEQSYIKGKAFITKNSGNAKLKVQFFWPLRGKYWIIDLADDYSYAVIGHPNRDYLWILSRTTTMDEMLYQSIVQKLEEKEFDTSKLKRTPQI